MNHSAKTNSAISQLTQGSTAKTINQRCIEMVRKMACLESLKEEYIDPLLVWYSSKDPPVKLAEDPVTIAWNLCRQGGILCAMINKFRGNTIDGIRPWKDPIIVSTLEKDPQAKGNLTKFISACRDDLYMTEDQLFDPLKLLSSDDTNTLNKVIDLANNFLERIKKIQAINFTKRETALMESNELYADIKHTGEAEKHKRLLVFDEIVSTERSYVADLELLSKYAEELKIDQILTPDTHKSIFSNLDDLTNFQRGFLIALERQVAPGTRSLQASYDAHFGQFLVQYKEGFRKYEMYCSNFNNAKVIAAGQITQLKAKAKIIDPVALESFLIKPVQRICKYHLLIRELIKSSPPEAPDIKELQDADYVMKQAADVVNEGQRRSDNMVAFANLKARVEDWKGIDPLKIGDLELFGSIIVAQGSVEKECDSFLFTKILIMCREGKKMLSSQKPLQIRANIQMNSLSSIEFKEDNSFNLMLKTGESFVFKFQNEEQMKKWSGIMEKLSPHPLTGAKKEVMERRKSRLNLAELRVPAVAPGIAKPKPAAALAPPVEENMRLKIEYRNEIYQILVPDLDSLEQLKKLALDKITGEYRFMGATPDLALNDIRCKYKDEFGDIIIMSTDDDMFDALQYSPNVIKVIITKKGDFRP
jgi:hypothetical protein